MNKDITLVIMAAGMGSRFGGLKHGRSGRTAEQGVRGKSGGIPRRSQNH